MNKAKTSTPIEATSRDRKTLYLSHFTPSMMPPETLQSMLVQRQPLIDACCDDVLHGVTTRGKHHYLFVGPRGIGKTHLISLLHHRLAQAPEVSARGLIAWMREEEWGVTSFFELILRILRTLDSAYPELDIARRREALYELPSKQAEAPATSLLLDVMGDKVLVILLENLDDLFDQLGDAGQRKLRGFVQNHPQFVLVATTPSLFAGVSLQKSPFYGFFDIQPLAEFSFDDVVVLLEKIAIERGDEPLAEFITTPQGRARIRAIHHLAEGNPRIYVIFAQFLSREALDELVQAVMHTLDELTPYYQARMKELSGQQRKIVEYLVHFRGAPPVKQIAKSCFITPQTCSGQLKLLREKRYVRSIEMGRESYYELTEPLMRLCMEVKQQRGEPIGLFVEILRIWYTEAELNDWLDCGRIDHGLERRYVVQALEIMRNDQEVDLILKALIDEAFQLREIPDETRILLVLEAIVDFKTRNEVSRKARLIALSIFSRFYSIVEQQLKLEITDAVEIFMWISSLQTANLKKEEAFPVYAAHMAIGASFFKILGKEMTSVFISIIDSFKKFPSHAAFAIIGINSSTEPIMCREFVEELFRHINDSSKNKSLGNLLKAIPRMVEAMTNWSRTKDKKHLLDLPKEERELILALKTDF